MRLAGLIIVIGLVACDDQAGDLPERHSNVESEAAQKAVSPASQSVDKRLLGVWERTKVSGEDYKGNEELDHMIWLIRDDGSCWLKEYSFADESTERVRRAPPNRRGYNASLEIDPERAIMTVLGFEIRYALTDVGRAYVLETDFVEKDVHQEFIKWKQPN